MNNENINRLNRLQGLIDNTEELNGLKIIIAKTSNELTEMQKENTFFKKQYEKLLELEEKNQSLKEELELLQKNVDTQKDSEESVKLYLEKAASPSSLLSWSSSAKIKDFDKYVQNYVVDPIALDSSTSSSLKDGILDDEEELYAKQQSSVTGNTSPICDFKSTVNVSTSSMEDDENIDETLLRDINLYNKIPFLSGYIKGTIGAKITSLKVEQVSLKKEQKTKLNQIYASIMRDTGDTKSYEEKQLAVSNFFSGRQPGTCSYIIPKVNEKERKNLCDIREYKKQHKFVAHYLSPWSNTRGILAWHSLGSGKTSIAVLTCAHHLREYYVFGNDRSRVIIFIVKKELIPNFSSEFRKYIPYEYVFGETEPSSTEEKNSKIDRVFRDRVFVTTYHDLSASLMGRKQWNNVPPEIANGLGIKNGQYKADSKTFRILENTLLIIDEAHNLVRPEKCDRGTFGQSTDYNVIADPFILKNCVQQTDDIKILLMTATPVAEKLSEFGILVNFMKHRVQDKNFMFPEIGDPLRVPNVSIPPEATRPNLKKTEETFQKQFFEEGNMKNQDIFLQCIAGWVSYFENTKDLNYYPSQRIQEVVTVMSDKHREFYEEAKKMSGKTTKTLQDVSKLRLEFTKLVTATRDAKKIMKHSVISDISTKLLAVLENIKVGTIDSKNYSSEKPRYGKQLVFTPFPSSENDRIYSSIAITKILEATTTFGKWKKLELKHLEDLQRFMKRRLSKTDTIFPEIGDKIFEIFDEKAFTDYMNKLRDGDRSVRFMVDLNSLAPGSTAVPAIIRDMVKELYNSTWNMEGEHINLLLFNKKFSEGISYFNVRTVHVVGTPLSLLDRDQAIGRAIRYCSHRRLNTLDKWNVTVFNYVMVFSEEEKQRYLNGSLDWVTSSSPQSGGAKTRSSMKIVQGKSSFGTKMNSIEKKSRKNKTSSTFSTSKCTDLENKLRLCSSSGIPISPDITMQQIAKEEAERFRTFLDLAKVGAVDCPLFHEVNDLPMNSNGSPVPCFKPLLKGNTDKERNRDENNNDDDDDDDDIFNIDDSTPCESFQKEEKCNNRDYCTWSKSSNFLKSAILGSKNICVPVTLENPKKCNAIKSPTHCEQSSVCHINKKKQICEQRINETWFGDWKFAITFEETDMVIPFSFPSENDVVSILNRIATMLRSKKSIYNDEDGAYAFGSDILNLLNSIRFKFNFFKKETINLQKEVSDAIHEAMTKNTSLSNIFQAEFVRRSMFKFATYYNQRLSRQVLKPKYFELETKLYKEESNERFFQVELNQKNELHFYIKLSIDNETTDDKVYYIDSDVSNASILVDETIGFKEDFTITKVCRAFPLYPLFNKSPSSYLKCLVSFHVLKIEDDVVSLSYIKLSVVSKRDFSTI